MITILESHETFANTVDGNYGRSLNSGYEYYARLQQVGSLCGSSSGSSSGRNFSVVEPADQLPVALLVSSHEYNVNATGTDDRNDDSDSDSNTACTLQTQMDYVLNHVFPTGLVKYLIVATAEEQEKEEQQQPEETPPRHHWWWWWPRNTMKHSTFPQNVNLYQEEKVPPLHVLHRTDEPLYILHVSTATYDTLYRHLERQTDNTVLEGGIQISMNDNRHSHRYYNGGGNRNEDQNEMILTTALIAFVTAGVCFLCLILCGAGDWDDDDDHNNNGGGAAAQPPRPVRQRLTREQVRERFPVYRYDGQSKLVRCGIHGTPSTSSSAPTDTTTTTTPLDSLQQPLLPVQSSSSTTTHGTVESSSSLLQNEVIENIVLDVCSICLDEYERLDKVRILPCHHTFHSKCVGRWLSERSAVCPLCKENYYIEEEEAAVDDAAAAITTNATINTPTPESSVPLWRRVWEHYAAVPPTTVTAETVNTTTTTNVDVEMPMETVVPEAPSHRAVATDVNDRISTSWWSRMFPQATLSSSSSSTSPLLPRNPPDSLTEPLLLPSQDDHVEANVPPAVESTVTDNTNSGSSPDTTVAPLRHTTTLIDTTGVSSSPMSHDAVTTTEDVQIHDTTVEPCDTNGVVVDDRGTDATTVVLDP